LDIFSFVVVCFVVLFHTGTGTGVKRSNTILSIHATMLFAIVAYSVCGVFGGLIYSNTEITSNLMYNYQVDMKSNDLMMHFLLLFWTIVMGFSVPTLMYSTKRTIVLSLLPILRDRRVGSAGPPPSWTTNALVSLVLSLIVGGLSLCIRYGAVEYIIVVLGTTTSTMLVIVCPAMFYLKLHGLCARDAYGRVASFGTGRFIAVVLLLIGLITGPICLVGSVLYWTDGYKKIR
jgi:hypothetical protein